MRQMRRDIALLLQSGQDATARIRVILITKMQKWGFLFNLIVLASLLESFHVILHLFLFVGSVFLHPRTPSILEPNNVKNVLLLPSL